jgi:hypothetical protein
VAKSFVCVGGPKARQRVAVGNDCPSFKAVVPRDYAVAPDQSSAEMLVQTVEYREERIEFDDGSHVSMWVPAGQTPHETVELLIKAYERTR